ncbi:MAG: MmcQ/YjbR family DNA-binding protein [Steroidobacteraceae bacterium]
MRASKNAIVAAKADPLLSRVRNLCLSLPETSEISSWGHPNFRAGKRTFVTFEHIEGVDTIAFHLAPCDVEDLQRKAGFVRTPYGQGHWVSLCIKPRPKWPDVEGLVLRSYKQVALKRMLKVLDESSRDE